MGFVIFLVEVLNCWQYFLEGLLSFILGQKHFFPQELHSLSKCDLAWLPTTENWRSCLQ